MQKIAVATKNGTEIIDNATVIGPFAIHEDWDGKHTVTHIFTGFYVIRCVTQAQALRVAKKLPELDDWYFGYLDIADYDPIKGSSKNKALATSLKFLRKIRKQAV